VHHLPVDSARTLIWLDIHFVVIDVNLRDVHFKVIGQELDWFPHSANARPARCLEHLLQGGAGRRLQLQDRKPGEGKVW